MVSPSGSAVDEIAQVRLPAAVVVAESDAVARRRKIAQRARVNRVELPSLPTLPPRSASSCAAQHELQRPAPEAPGLDGHQVREAVLLEAVFVHSR